MIYSTCAAQSIESIDCPAIIQLKHVIFLNSKGSISKETINYYWDDDGSLNVPEGYTEIKTHHYNNKNAIIKSEKRIHFPEYTKKHDDITVTNFLYSGKKLAKTETGHEYYDFDEGGTLTHYTDKTQVWHLYNNAGKPLSDSTHFTGRVWFEAGGEGHCSLGNETILSRYFYYRAKRLTIIKSIRNMHSRHYELTTKIFKRDFLIETEINDSDVLPNGTSVVSKREKTVSTFSGNQIARRYVIRYVNRPNLTADTTAYIYSYSSQDKQILVQKEECIDRYGTPNEHLQSSRTTSYSLSPAKRVNFVLETLGACTIYREEFFYP